jgi:succinate dehydrogenase/fumarate reductase flavoprotein subunit
VGNLGLQSGVCDVLVAGSGAGGFAAALTASLHGLDVIMVEKESLFGGTTAYSAGVIWIPVNSLRRRLASPIPETMHLPISRTMLATGWIAPRPRPS